MVKVFLVQQGNESLLGLPGFVTRLNCLVHLETDQLFNIPEFTRGRKNMLSYP